MKIRLLLTVIAVWLLTFVQVYSQPAETIYLGTTIKEGSANDASYGPYNIGFSFIFYGTSYTQFYVSTNGLVSFETGSVSNAETNIPSVVLPDNFIAGFWDDLKIDGFGSISYASIGASPNRKLIVQFRNMGFYPSPTYMGTFSVILYETSNIIQTQYRMIVLQDVPRAKGADAAIGIESSGGTSGIEFAYHDPAAVTSWKAVSYTPSGSTYTVNEDAIYDGIYLTKNLTVPEPGVTELISPSNGSTVGTDVSFQWGTSERATRYYLRVADNPEMAAATTYYSGTDLSFTKTGLTDGVTYYWTVLAYNATGYTWNEVKKFSVSATPPLTAVPQTIWTEQGSDKTITLNYTGGDASSKNAVITSLPLQGQLFQYNGGIRGAQITSVPETLTDEGRRVIYTAPASSGNGIGNFKFRMNDANGDSPEATITVNVSPPGIPSVIAVAKGSSVEIQFDREMSDPAGKHSQFTVTVNGTPATLTSATLKTGDPYTILLTLNSALTGSETVSVAYTMGDITSIQGGFLFSFTDIPVTLSAQTINFAQSLDKKLNQSPFNLIATSSSSLGLTYSSSNTSVATISGNIVTLLTPGISEITARQAGNTIYAPARYERTLSVSKGDQVITFNPLATKTFGEADFNLTATASSGLPITYVSSNTDVATVTGNTVHIIAAGSTIITASQAGNTNWNAATSVDQTLNVQKADQTITFGVLDMKTYGDVDFSLTATSTSVLPVSYTSSNTGVATVTGNMVHIVATGESVITASQAGNTNWNAATPVDQTLTVQKADQAITFGVLDPKTYGDADFSLTATSASGLPVTYSSGNTGVATVTGNTVHITGAGTTVITASQEGNTNWNAATPIDQALDVQKADQSITFDALPVKQPTDPDFNPGAISSSGLTVAYSSDNPLVASIIGSMIHIAGEGTAIITASQPGNADYNAAADVSRNLVVSITTGAEDPYEASNSFSIYLQGDKIILRTLQSSWNGQKGSITVYNIKGMPVLNLRNITFSTNSVLELQAPESKGIYLIDVKSGNKRFTGRIVW